LDAQKALEDLSRIKRMQSEQNQESPRPTEAEILKAIEDRALARKSKDFAKADSIRKDLEARGVLIKDSPAGTTWEYQ
jgi:cysteinyl-tRNA synthetase